MFMTLKKGSVKMVGVDHINHKELLRIRVEEDYTSLNDVIQMLIKNYYDNKDLQGVVL